MTVDWLCIGQRRWRGPSLLSAIVARALNSIRRLTPRVSVQRWVRYEADVATATCPDVGPTLTKFDDGIISLLRRHPDASHPDFASSIDFWNRGFHGGFVWLDNDEPLCSQWLFTARDNAALRVLPVWGSMYPPLVPGVGQVEKLWAFSSVRHKGVASQFAQMMFREARLQGLRTLFTHIHESNGPARMWAQRTGWSAYGTITRYQFDFPLLRNDAFVVCVHTGGDVPPMPAKPQGASSAAVAAPVAA